MSLSDDVQTDDVEWRIYDFMGRDKLLSGCTELML